MEAFASRASWKEHPALRPEKHVLFAGPDAAVYGAGKSDPWKIRKRKEI